MFSEARGEIQHPGNVDLRIKSVHRRIQGLIEWTTNPKEGQGLAIPYATT